MFRFCILFLVFAFSSSIHHSAYAEDKFDLYTRLVGSVGQYDIENIKTTELRSHSSRLGVKASHVISDKLKIAAKVEYGVSFDDGNPVFSQRDIYLDLQLQFGTFRFGHYNTPFKNTIKGFDFFKDYNADLKRIVSGQYRLSNQVSYHTPKFKNMQVQVSAILSETDGVDEGLSFAYLYTANKFRIDVGVESKVRDTDQFRVIGMYLGKRNTIGAMYQVSEPVDNSTQQKETTIAFAYQLKFKSTYSFALTYTDNITTETNENDIDTSQIAIGVTNKMSKKFRIFYDYYTRTVSTLGAQDVKQNGIAVGFRVDLGLKR